MLGELPEGYELREPYAGGASVSLHMLRSGRASKVWINDLDPSVQATWNAVIQEPEALLEAIARIPHSWKSYLSLCQATDLEGVHLAAATIYKQAVGFGAILKSHGFSKEKAQQWDPRNYIPRVHGAHDLLAGRCHEDRCTGYDALDVIQAPGQAVLFLDPPYAGVGETFYNHAYNPQDFENLGACLQSTHHPWVMTVGDDQVSDAMNLPGASRYRIPETIRKQQFGSFFPWWHAGEEPTRKREQLLVSEAAEEMWGLRLWAELQEG